MAMHGIELTYDKNGNLKTGTMENTFAIGQWPEKLWKLFFRVLTGDVENKGKNKKDFTNPEKITHFKELTGTLSVDEKMRLLSSVIMGERTMKEMADEAGILRRVKKVQKFLMFDFGFKNLDWDACKSAHPLACKATEIDLWIKCSTDFSRNPHRRPLGWENFIERSKRIGTQEQDLGTMTKRREFKLGSLKYIFHLGDVTTLFNVLDTNRGDYGKTYFILFVCTFFC